MSVSNSWYVANKDWGDDSQAVWKWMVTQYNKKRVAGGGGYRACRCGCEFVEWKDEVDETLKFWQDKFDREAAKYMAPNFGQWIKGRYDEAQKVNEDDNVVPGPRQRY